MTADEFKRCNSPINLSRFHKKATQFFLHLMPAVPHFGNFKIISSTPTICVPTTTPMCTITRSEILHGTYAPCYPETWKRESINHVPPLLILIYADWSRSDFHSVACSRLIARYYLYLVQYLSVVFPQIQLTID